MTGFSFKKFEASHFSGAEVRIQVFWALNDFNTIDVVQTVKASTEICFNTLCGRSKSKGKTSRTSLYHTWAVACNRISCF